MNHLKKAFLSLHIVWAIIGVSITVVLATSTKGHPPAAVFAPVALALWVAGHVLLWFSRKLAIQGNDSVEKRDNAGGKWPLTLILLAFIFGCVFILGLFAITTKALIDHNWQSQLPIFLVIWLPPSICFVGILLRQAWSRILAGGGFIAVALFLLYQMVEGLVHGNRHSALDWITGIVILLIFLFLGQHILRFPKINAFYSK